MVDHFCFPIRRRCSRRANEIACSDRWFFSGPQRLFLDHTCRNSPSNPRELAAFFYYPAKSNGEKADYFPGLSGLAPNPNTRVLQLQFGSAWQAVAAGTIRGNAYTDAPFVSGREKFPVLIFSPGLGAPSLAYSVQLEELASH